MDTTAPVPRLRPIVHASPVPDGLHVRGARSSFTMNGGAGLWRLWQALSGSLAEGRPVQQLLDQAVQPTVRNAITMLVAQLYEHDMLVEVPSRWGETGEPNEPPHRIARWLEAVAPDPLAAWRRIAAAEITVEGTGPIAAAAARALTSTGATFRPGGEVVRDQHLVMAAGEISVAAAVGSDVGFVTPVGVSAAVRRDAVAIADHVRMSTTREKSSNVLAALVAGAAAHRLICAVAELPDPAEDRFAASLDTASMRGYPAVLIARLDPLRADYHPWLAGSSPAVAPPPPVPTAQRISMAHALSKVDLLGDPELGALPAVELDDLPQLPVALAQCQADEHVVYGVGADTAAARLGAALGAAADMIGKSVDGEVVIGVDRTHADGMLLRRLVHRHQSAFDGEEVSDSSWASAVPARSWWKALTLRFGVAAKLRVRRLAAEVFHAELHSAGQTLSWAVERTPADAAAFCALTAVGTAQWHAAHAREGNAPAVAPTARIQPPCGALPKPAAAEEPGDKPWQTGTWIWPGQLADHEPAFQHQLRQLLGDRIPPTVSVPANDVLAQALTAVGFVIEAVTP